MFKTLKLKPFDTNKTFLTIRKGDNICIYNHGHCNSYNFYLLPLHVVDVDVIFRTHVRVALAYINLKALEYGQEQTGSGLN